MGLLSRIKASRSASGTEPLDSPRISRELSSIKSKHFRQSPETPSPSSPPPLSPAGAADESNPASEVESAKDNFKGFMTEAATYADRQSKESRREELYEDPTRAPAADQPMQPQANADTPENARKEIEDAYDENPNPNNEVPSRLTPPDDSSYLGKMVTVRLKEATIDSPSFRASMEHLNFQVQILNKWFSELLFKMNAFCEHMDSTKMHVNSIIDEFMPKFIDQNLVQQDFATIACASFADSMRISWARNITQAKKKCTIMVKLFKDFKAHPLTNFKDARKVYLERQSVYDDELAKYMGLSRKTPPSVLCETAAQVFEKKQKYLLASINFLVALTDVQNSADRLIIRGLCDPNQITQLSLQSCLGEVEIARLMFRLHTYNKQMEYTFSKSLKDIKRISKDSIKRLQDAAPSKYLKDYDDDLCQNGHQYPAEGPTERYGWLFVYLPTDRSHSKWARCWGFVSAGMFGWLQLSSDKRFVQESQKYNLLTCSARATPSNDRLFCFTVRTNEQSVVIQAETKASLKAWLSVFETGKADATTKEMPLLIRPFSEKFASGLSKSVTLTPSSSSTRQRYNNDLPLTPTTSIYNDTGKAMTLGLASDTDFQASKHFEQLEKFLSDPVRLLQCDALHNVPRRSIYPPVLSNKIMPTSETLTALVGKVHTRPYKIPNALTANIVGSVNWTAQKIPEGKYPVKATIGNVSYPNFYPETLMYHDFDMRVAFDLPFTESENDLLLLVIRGVYRLNRTHSVPIRLFVTSNTIRFYACHSGVQQLAVVPLSQLLAIEDTPGLEYDTLELRTRKGSILNSHIIQSFIETGSLCQRRLQYILDNFNSNSPASIKEVLSTLDGIRDNLSESFHKSLQRLGESDRTIEDPDSHGNVSPVHLWLQQLFNVTAKDRVTESLSVETRKYNGSISGQRNPKRKYGTILIRKKYFTSPKALFYMIFGESSPLFSSDEPVDKVSPLKEPNSWYWRNNRLTRHVCHITRSFLPFIGGSHDIHFTQQIERRDEGNLYIVSSCTPTVRLPDGIRMVVKLRYLIESRRDGCKLWMWADLRLFGDGPTYNAVEGMILLGLHRIAEFVDTSIGLIMNKEGRGMSSATMMKRYGPIKGVKVISHDSETRGGERRSTITLSFYYGNLGLYFFRNIRHFVQMLFTNLFKALANAATSNTFITVVFALSIVLNFYFASRESVVAWKSFWEVRDTARYVDSLEIAPRQGNLFKRAIYSKDVSEIISSSKFYFEDISENSEISDNLCLQRFNQLVRHSSDIDEFGPLSLVQVDQAMLNELQSFRSNIASRRMQLLVDARLLHNTEEEYISRKWKQWLVSEVDMCRQARLAIAELNMNHTRLAELTRYCVNCIGLEKQIL